MKTFEQRMLEIIAATEQKNAELKEQLETTEDALNFLIMQGGQVDV